MNEIGNKKKLTRAHIMKVGTRHFLDKGFKETLIIDIAKEAGLDRRTIYRYFPSKESLLIHIAADEFRHFSEAFENYTFAPNMTGYEKIKDLFASYFQLLKDRPNMILFLGMVDTNVGREMYYRDDYIVLDQFGKRLDKVLERLVEEGQNDGSINLRFPPYEYALTVSNSLIALATRIAIYLPNVIKQGQGFSWGLLINQGNILIDSMENKE
jgi:AcrR family transcriptional regulator